LLVPAIETHQAALGRTPHLVAADAAFYSNNNEKRRSKGRQARLRPQSLHQKRRAQTRAEEALVPRRPEMATGCEGRISVEKRRHGLNRSRYKGDDGMKRWVGFGVIADNVINIGAAWPSGAPRPKQAARSKHTA